VETELPKVLKLLQRINQIDPKLSGEKYLKYLLQTVAEGLGVSYACIGRPVKDQPQIRTDLLLMDGVFVDNIVYDLEGTPCEDVICGGRVSCYASGVVDLFPHDTMLKDLGIESYVGARTLNLDGTVLGLVILFDTKPIENRDEYSFVAEFLAARVGAEYRRLEYEEGLQRVNEDLERLADQRKQELAMALRRLLSQEKLATIGRVTFGIAHELRNPLNVIINSADLIKDIIEENPVAFAEFRDPADLIVNQSLRANAIISNMLMQARQDMGSTAEEVDLSDLVNRSLNMCMTSLSDPNFRTRLKIIRDIEPQVVLKLVDPSSVERVFINLLDNSIYALKEKVNLSPDEFIPEIQVHLKTLSDQVLLSFEDNGTGISTAHMGHVFEEFYTTKPAGDGTGLGLSIAKGTVEKNGGHIDLITEYGHYTKINILFPGPLAGRA
jgi:signal transduction histidine kinase